MSKQIHTHLGTMEQYDIGKAAHAYITELLHKVSLRKACQLLGVSTQTMYRWLDESKGYDSIARMAGCYIVFMCELDPMIKRTLDNAPLSRHAYYYKPLKETK